MFETQKRTLASTVYEVLRADIISGGFEGVSKLNIRQLAARFDTGMAPIREALSRLSTEGLVAQMDRRGFAVVPTSIDELWDLHHARVTINEVCLRESIAWGDRDWEEGVLVACHRLLRVERPQDDIFHPVAVEWTRLHRAFHHALLSACRSPRLLHYCDRLFDDLERYRHVGRHVASSRPHVADEHRAIMEAVIARDADAAVSLLSAHYRTTAERVDQALRQRNLG